MTPGPVSQFIDHHYRHFNAAALKDAANAYSKHIDDGGIMLLTLAGAMSTAELGISLAEMIRQGKVNGIVCTGANLEEDIFNLVAHDFYERIPNYRDLTPADEQALLDRHMNRVTDTCIPEMEAMRRIENVILREWMAADSKGERLFPHEFFWRILDSDELKASFQIDPKNSWMIAAMEKLRGAIARRRPRPGRLRAVSFGAIISGIAALGVFWMPDAMVRHPLSVVPAARKATIGEAMLDEMRRMTGPRCTEASALPALGRLANRLQDASGKAPTLAVISTGVTGVKALPGGLLLVDRRLIEEEEAPDALAGYILAAMDASRLKTPLEGLLESSGIVATFQLLTTGELPPDAMREYSETLLAAPWPPIHPTDLLGAFRRNEVRSTPFANRLPEGHPEIQTLKAKDPYPEAAPRPVLDDADWVRLQGICGN